MAVGNGAWTTGTAPRRTASTPWAEARRRRWGTQPTHAPDAQDAGYISHGTKNGVVCPNPQCGCKKNSKGYLFCRQCGFSLTGKGKKVQEGSSNGAALPGLPGFDSQPPFAHEKL